jgi:hypothetical protein
MLGDEFEHDLLINSLGDFAVERFERSGIVVFLAKEAAVDDILDSISHRHEERGDGSDFLPKVFYFIFTNRNVMSFSLRA